MYSTQTRRKLWFSTTVQDLKDSNLKLAQAYKTVTGKNTNNNKRQFDDKFVWKKIPPKGKEPKIRQKRKDLPLDLQSSDVDYTHPL